MAEKEEGEGQCEKGFL